MNEPARPTQTPAGWVDVGRLVDLSDGGCAAAVDDRVLLIRHGATVLGFVNRCLHRDTPLHEGHISAGTLACPLHHWRYGLDDGRLVGGTAQLAPVTVQVRDGRVLVDPPDEPAASIGAFLREHARTWSRDDPPQPRSAGGSSVVGTPPPTRHEDTG